MPNSHEDHLKELRNQMTGMRKLADVLTESLSTFDRALSKAEATIGSHSAVDKPKPPDDDNKRNRRSSRLNRPFRFSMVNISPSEVLTFKKDSNIKCVVANDKQVKFRGKTMSLSAAAGRAIGGTGKYSGPDFWMYNDETLNDRRDRME